MNERIYVEQKKNLGLVRLCVLLCGGKVFLGVYQVVAYSLSLSSQRFLEDAFWNSERRCYVWREDCGLFFTVAWASMDGFLSSLSYSLLLTEQGSSSPHQDGETNDSSNRN